MLTGTFFFGTLRKRKGPGYRIGGRFIKRGGASGNQHVIRRYHEICYALSGLINGTTSNPGFRYARFAGFTSPWATLLHAFSVRCAYAHCRHALTIVGDSRRRPFVTCAGDGRAALIWPNRYNALTMRVDRQGFDAIRLISRQSTPFNPEDSDGRVHAGSDQ